MNNSQNFESFVPVYDTVPESWEEGRQFLVEHLKKISNAVNVREIGYYLEEELLSGGSFTPPASTTTITSAGSNQFRSILRKMISFSPLVAGANVRAHGVNFNNNFRLIKIYGAATNTGTLIADPIAFGTPAMDATNINVVSAGAYDLAQVVIEYILEA